MFHQPQIGFVNQCSALEGVARTLAFETMMGKAPELVIDQRY
jgi:hypothetical protein